MSSRRSLDRLLLNIVLDGMLAALAVPLARWIAAPGFGVLSPLWELPAGAVALLIGGLPFRLSLQYWRFAGINDLLGLVGGSLGGAAVFALLLWSLELPWPSLSFPVIHALTLLVVLGTPRAAYRLSKGRPRGLVRRADETSAEQTVLLVGAGEGADLFLRALSQDRRQMLRVIGLLSLGSRQTGRRIHGYPILGSLAEAEAVLAQLAEDQALPALLVVTDTELAGAPLGRLLEAAERLGIAVRRAPRPTALHPARRAAEAIALQPVSIEELLNRPQVRLDRDGMARLIQGRRVLVTGAGGSIGSELARQVAALGPDQLVLLDNGEYALWQIDLELAESHPGVPRRAVIADVRDEPRIRALCEEIRPELVFHAAALKHVPIGEANPLEDLLTNAVGTRHVADAARAAGAQAMVLISTDKAVNPSSIMGASKRLAEMYCQALDMAACRAGSGMRCVTVRFGNVLGSTGSVVPLFRRQLERGGPLTVTHPDMSRYFMTVREAVGLVLQASVVGTGDAVAAAREGGIFVLDMGQPVKIVDLARQMIRLAGLRPDQDVEIRFTGLRPGEKLFEELFHGMEPPVPTGHEGLLMAAPRTADAAIVGRALEEIAHAARAGQLRLALAQLGRLVPEYECDTQAGAGSARA